jgi:hypothetical protein
MLSNHFWDGFVLGALFVLGTFFVSNLLTRSRAREQWFGAGELGVRN